MTVIRWLCGVAARLSIWAWLLAVAACGGSRSGPSESLDDLVRIRPNPGAPPPPILASFSPDAGVIGASVILQGQHFTGAVAVQFNGTNAVYHVETDIEIHATVPAGASTGPVSVTTPGGTASSHTPFTVLPSYRFADSGSVFPTSTCIAYGINQRGTVVGRCFTPTGKRAFLWTEEGGSIDFSQRLGNVPSAANAVNDLGEVVGEMLVAGYWHAFFWSELTGAVDLGILEGGLNSSALAINDSSVVVGCADVRGVGHTTCTDFSGNTWHAAVWAPSRSIRDLGTFGGNYSEAHGINSCGHVVGWAELTPGVPRAFLYSEESGMINLGTVTDGSAANAINDSGLIVGESNLEPFLYDETGMHLIAGRGTATSINNRGQIVAQLLRPDGGNSAFLYQGGAWIELVSFLPAGADWHDFLLPKAINDRGSIAGQGYLRNVDPARAFFMTPVE